MAWSVFLIARQGFIIDAVPPAYRARAPLGARRQPRIGVFVGPLLGAGLIHVCRPAVGVRLAAVLSLAAALLAL